MKRVLLAALLAAACGAPVPTASPTSAPKPIPSPAPSGCGSPLGPGPTPGCTPDPAHAYRKLPAAHTELAPGRYYKEGFTPPVGFAVDDGWTTVQQLNGFFDIQDDPGSLDVVAVQFTRASDAVTAELAAADIESRANLVVGQREQVEIGGLTGIRLIADTTDPANGQPVLFRPVLNTPAGPISIGSGRRLEVNLFTIPDGVLAILVGGSIARWDRALELSRPVLESVVVSI